MKKSQYLSICCLLILSTGFLHGQEIRTYLDLQMHPTMHVPYSFFGKGFQYFEEGKEPKRSFKHQFKNVNFANYWANNKGARIIVSGALTKENVKRRSKAKKTILKQLNYVNDFVNEHPEDFVVAKSPEEVRHLFTSTNKTIIIHSIEGAKKLINSQEDANFWASQGVAFFTLIHLVDSKLGSAAIRPGLTKMINFKGWIRKKSKRGGLTEKGKENILWLANAGIMTDITHMSDQCRKDALDFMEENGLPPIATHDVFRPIQNHPRGISEEQIIRIYKNQGFISLPISGISLSAYRPEKRYQEKIETLDCFCEGSIDSYKLTYQEVQHLIESNYQEIDPNILGSFEELSESKKVKFSIGFQSDFNGWLNHSRPRFGKEGCAPIDSTKNYEAIELDGMPHPGYLESQWNLLEKEGVDLSPIQRNAERFLQLWEWYRKR